MRKELAERLERMREKQVVELHKDSKGIYWQTFDGVYRVEPQTLPNGLRKLIILKEGAGSDGVSWGCCYAFGQETIEDCIDIIENHLRKE